MNDSTTPLLSITEDLSRAVDALEFDNEKVDTIYNPLNYAHRQHTAYLQRFAKPPKRFAFMGMNPGPWGMAQTGVPFGSIPLVRDWLGIDGEVDRPEPEHPKRPVEGFDCERVEISGKRFWGWLSDHFETPEGFFERGMVWNYCPLVFMADSGRNVTPNKLPKAEREALHAVCDQALRAAMTALEVDVVIGIGRYAERRAKAALGDTDIRIAHVLHPSPASPLANAGWTEKAEAALEEQSLRELVLGTTSR